MTRVKGLNAAGGGPGDPAREELSALESLAQRVHRAEQTLDALHRERHELVRAASAKGASRRRVAAAAGITAGRVQQILDRQRT